MDFESLKAKLAFRYAESFAALAANRELHIKLPAQTGAFFGAWFSAKAEFFGAGSGVITLTESIATAADGTPIVQVCRSRLDAPPASPVPAFHTPTTPTGGTVIDTSAGAVSQPAELCHWILKPGTNYLLRLAPTSNPSGVLSFDLGVIPNFDWLYLRKK